MCIRDSNGAVSAAISFLRTFVFQIVIVLILPKLIGITGVWPVSYTHLDVYKRQSLTWSS